MWMLAALLARTVLFGALFNNSKNTVVPSQTGEPWEGHPIARNPDGSWADRPK